MSDAHVVALFLALAYAVGGVVVAVAWARTPRDGWGRPKRRCDPSREDR